MISFVNNNKIKIASAALIAAECFLWVAIQHVGGLAYSILTVISVALCTAFVLVFANRGFGGVLVKVALACTLAADVFLSGLFSWEHNQVVAMCFFLCVQACYFLRLLNLQKTQKSRKTHVIVRSILSVIAAVAAFAVLVETVNALAVISAVYYFNLLLNIIYAFSFGRGSLMFAVGLSLFACCDLFVGLNVLEDSFLLLPEYSLISKINGVNLNLAWLFYPPSQVLISLSSLGKGRDGLKNY